MYHPESMDTTALANCQTHQVHEVRSITIDGWRLTNRVQKRCFVSVTGPCSYTFITAVDSQRLLFSPFHDQQLRQLDCCMSLCLASQKLRALAGFGAKGRCVVDKTREICAVFQLNATRIHGNSANNVVLSPRFT